MTLIDKFNAFLASTKGMLIQAAVFIGVANVIFYLFHIEHLPKLSLLESVTSIASFGAISGIALLIFAALLTLPSLIFVAFNIDIQSKASGFTSARWASIIVVETLLILLGHQFYVSLAIHGPQYMQVAYVTFAIVLTLLLWGLSLNWGAIYHAAVVFLVSFVYLYLYALIDGTEKGLKEWYGVLGIIIPTSIILWSAYVGGKHGNWCLAIAILLTPFAFTMDLRRPYILPKLSMKIARQGSFFAEKLVLDKKGCQIVSSNPANECVADTYYVCSAYVLSRLGDPTLVRLFHYDRKGVARPQTVEIPPASILGMTMDKEHRLLKEEDVDQQLEQLARNCNYPSRFVLDGLFSFGKSELDDNARRRIVEVLSPLLTNGNRPPLRILGYADESGSKASNHALSQERAVRVQDYIVSLGYPKDMITLISEGPLKPIGACKKTSVQGKYDCGRPSRRVEIEVGNF